MSEKRKYHKKVISLFIAVSMFLSLLPLSVVAAGVEAIENGIGIMEEVVSETFVSGITATEPTLTTDKYDLDGDNVYDSAYEIGTADELYWFSETVNGGSNTINAVLTADIVVNENVVVDGALTSNTEQLIAWVPIGGYYVNYEGHFDGLGHTISGLYFNDNTAVYVGLFGYLSYEASVKNTGVIDSFFCADYNIGGICGYNYGSIERCYSTSIITGSNYIGGISGRNDAGNGHRGSILYCYNTGGLSSTGSYIGGITSYNLSTIVGCYNIGTVSGGNALSGGICAPDYSDGSVINCYYLIGCATDGSGVVQNGTGNTTKGKISEEYEKCTFGLTNEEFENGTAAYYLNESVNGDGVWYQNLDNGETTDKYPVSDSSHGKVYAEYKACDSVEFSNSASGNQEAPHNFENGFCSLCGDFQKAVKATDKYDIDDDGSNDVVYELSNAGQLYWFSECVNEGLTRSCAVVTDDIVVNRNVLAVDGSLNSGNYVEWTPLGCRGWTHNTYYYGTIDGKGHTISGLYCNRPSYSYVGFCGDLMGIIKNLCIVDSYFCGKNNVGSIAGCSTSYSIVNCINDGTVVGEGYSIGGVCGQSYSALIDNCCNNGSVIGSNEVGGVCGYNRLSTLSNSYNTGSVKGAGSSVGGVCGKNEGTVSESYNVADVSNTGNEVGGICGYSAGEYGIYDCYNTGSVSGNNNYVGGVCGNQYSGNIIDCYNTGAVKGECVYVGGICGFASEIIKNSYYLEGCAKDGDDVVQSGVGTSPNASSVFKEDLVFSTIKEDFESGVITYYLNNFISGGKVWYQNLDNGDTPDLHPVLDNTHGLVYPNFNGCVINASNTSSGMQTPEHNYIDGQCVVCGNYLLLVPTTDKYDMDADGVCDEVYEISNAAELFWFAKTVNSGNTTMNAVLTADIVINSNLIERLEYDDEGKVTNSSDFVSWIPMGCNKTIAQDKVAYSGIFDGQGHTITGLFFSDAKAYVGLFGHAECATIRNLGILDSYFSAGSYMGSICGNIYDGKILNCYSTGVVRGTSQYVGGIVGGGSNTSVTNCYNTGSVQGLKYVGAVCGSYLTCENCYYSAGCAVDGSGVIQSGAGSSTQGSASIDKEGKCTGKMKSDFESGCIAYLLNGSVNEGSTWYQNIDNGLTPDPHPVLDKAHGKIYLNYSGCTVEGSNYYTENPVPVHNYVDGFCSVCGEYEGGLKTTDKYDLDNDGTCDEAYEISNAGQLYWFAQKVNNGSKTINGVLTKNITVNHKLIEGLEYDDSGSVSNGSDFMEWTPIGYKNASGDYSKYGGIFDGQGCTISGLYCGSGSTYTGLFAQTNKATIKNLGIVDSYFYGNNYVGGICAYGTTLNVLNCYNASVVKNKGSNTGGVCGYVNVGEISGCYNTGTVTGTGEKIGGICANATSCIVSDCYNTASVTGSNKYTGGVLGYSSKSTVTKCYNTGETEGSNYYVGGIAGYKSNGTISNCYNIGSVHCESNYIGGISGYNSGGAISNCYNTGSVVGDSYYAGGVLGYKSSGTISGCYYLVDCAENVNSVKQNGIGESSTNSVKVDVIGSTESKTKEKFENGEVCWLLQSAQQADAETGLVPLVWGQLSFEEGSTPILTDDEAYQVSALGNSATGISGYSVNAMGDFNDDGYVDVTDYQLLINLALSEENIAETATDEVAFNRSDMDNDGVVDVIDAVLAERLINS